MRVHVVRLRHRGLPLDRAKVSYEAAVVGDLYVEEHVDNKLGRTLRVARLAPERPRDPQLLPQLADVQLLWCGAHGFVLNGTERVSDAEYAQSWWCRLP